MYSEPPSMWSILGITAIFSGIMLGFIKLVQYVLFLCGLEVDLVPCTFIGAIIMYIILRIIRWYLTSVDAEVYF